MINANQAFKFEAQAACAGVGQIAGTSKTLPLVFQLRRQTLEANQASGRSAVKGEGAQGNLCSYPFLEKSKNQWAPHQQRISLSRKRTRQGKFPLSIDLTSANADFLDCHQGDDAVMQDPRQAPLKKRLLPFSAATN